MGKGYDEICVYFIGLKQQWKIMENRKLKYRRKGKQKLQNRNCLEKHIDSFHVNQITKIFLVLFFSTEA